LLELQDPRIQDVTVTFVEVAGDMRTAKVHVSIMSDEKQQELTLHGLRSAAGYLQQQIGDRIDTRYIPRLTFVLDEGVKHSLKISRILQDVLSPKTETTDPESPVSENPARDEITPSSS
jgi:ribosome-binding factor A